MLFPSLSVPTGLSNFFTNRRRTFTWVATTVGGAYLLGQWGFRKVEEAAERSRRERLDKDKCVSWALSFWECATEEDDE